MKTREVGRSLRNIKIGMRVIVPWHDGEEWSRWEGVAVAYRPGAVVVRFPEKRKSVEVRKLHPHLLIIDEDATTVEKRRKQILAEDPQQTRIPMQGELKLGRKM